MAAISRIASIHFWDDVMSNSSNSVNNTNICEHCGQALKMVGLDFSKCLNCNWIKQPDQKSMPTALEQPSRRRKASSPQQEGTQLDFFGGM